MIFRLMSLLFWLTICLSTWSVLILQASSLVASSQDSTLLSSWSETTKKKWDSLKTLKCPSLITKSPRAETTNTKTCFGCCWWEECSSKLSTTFSLKFLSIGCLPARIWLRRSWVGLTKLWSMVLLFEWWSICLMTPLISFWVIRTFRMDL